MNAGRDVERLIAGWLVEESPGRAPDRILANAADTIDRTKQRRFAVAWREPVSISLRGLAIAAALVAIAVVGAGWIGRSTAAGGNAPAPSPSITASPTADAAGAVAQYRAAWNAVCSAAASATPVPNSDLWSIPTLFNPAMPAPDRAKSLEVGRTLASGFDGLADRLDALDVPAGLQPEHLAYTTRLRDVATLLRSEVDLLAAGRYTEAQAVDHTTDAINAPRESFQAKYELANCP